MTCLTLMYPLAGMAAPAAVGADVIDDQTPMSFPDTPPLENRRPVCRDVPGPSVVGDQPD